jgi:hypothetical protein
MLSESKVRVNRLKCSDLNYLILYECMIILLFFRKGLKRFELFECLFTCVTVMN